jgi:RNA polymerase sigma-70 factor, ECF subfamily
LSAQSDDATLIARVKGGDLEAYGELYQRYLEPIYRYLRLRVSDDRHAEDLAEITFIRAFEALHRYHHRGHAFSAFLFQIARNLLTDHYRRQSNEAPLETVDSLPSPAQSPDEVFDTQERLAAVRQALESLPEDYQEVIRLRVILEMPTPTAAAWLGRSEQATRVLLHRALGALRKRLSEMHE